MTVNGVVHEVEAGCTLADLVQQGPGIACAVNGDVVRTWHLVVLDDGDAVEVLTAMQGG